MWLNEADKSRADSVNPTTVNTPDESGPATPDGRLAALAATLPVTAGGDPLPPGTNGSAQPTDLPPPPSIEGMPPLSATAMSSFASAANGVTTAQAGSEANANGTNGQATSTQTASDGKVVLNGIPGFS